MHIVYMYIEADKTAIYVFFSGKVALHSQCHYSGIGAFMKTEEASEIKAIFLSLTYLT